MAPKNRIVTLDDINNPATTNTNNSNNTNFREDALTATVDHPSSSVGSRNQKWLQDRGSEEYKSNNGYDYCKPIGRGHAAPSGPRRGAIPLHTIPGLRQSDVCMATLKRIHDEFFPIVQRRGYNVTSISELCCCGDGLDHVGIGSTTKKKPRKRRKMGNNVLGYNQTTFRRSGFRQSKNNSNTAKSKSTTSHSIHLRLRRPENHQQLYPWEDVAGTMAHELSHCVHQNHGAEFYKLMEEILEEHAMLQAQRLSSGDLHRGTTARMDNDNNHWSTSGMPTGDFPATGGSGHRLGSGSSSTNGGKSRLLEEFSAGGFRLGGRGNRGGPSGRELAARAAESRQRQMLQIRKAIERSKEPCVIELFDNDEEDDNNDDDTNAAQIHTPNGTQSDVELVVLDSGKTRGSNHRRKLCAGNKQRRMNSKRNNLAATNNTSTNDDDPIVVASDEEPSSSSSSPRVIDLTEIGTNPIAAGTGNIRWSCGLCTYKNRATADRCKMCLGPR